MKIKILFYLVLFAFILSACDSKPPIDEEILENFHCMNTPLAEGCYVPSGDLDHINPISPEYLVYEDFETEMLNQTPGNWLLYSNPEYRTNGVRAVVIEEEGNRFVRMFSDGLQKPPYPQAAQTPTFIFTTKFNLDQTRSGVAYASLKVPSIDGNAVSVGVSTGAVNTISANINEDMSLSIKVGGPFFYFSGSGDAGTYINTNMTLAHDTWHHFKFEWDASIDEVRAYIIIDDETVLLHSGPFHISNRFNAEANGEILVPNVIKVTMPSGRNINGYSYLDNVIVERKED